MPGKWSDLDFLLVRIESDMGLVGWGEGFGYFCNEAVAAVLKRSIAPLLIDRELTDPAALMEEIQRAMVLQGRHGISTFAQSGVDIALWDLMAKSEQVPLHRLLGDSKERDAVPAYASLLRYADEELVARYAEKALGEGYPELKLHEITLPEIRRCHEVTGGEVPVSIDVNCNWSEPFTREAIPELIERNTSWLEEPVFPPEDFRLLASLRDSGLPIATGENACTATPFAEMIRLGAGDLLQPSITKVGGVTEFRKVCRLVEGAEARLMPHSPYFGPGYLATLQMAAIEPQFELFEYLYIEPEAWLFADMPLPQNGEIPIADGVGLGADPDPEILERYAAARP
jgi:L-alanine-DL-glutamate epimerase-like enolase superfamily enzyme